MLGRIESNRVVRPGLKPLAACLALAAAAAAGAPPTGKLVVPGLTLRGSVVISCPADAPAVRLAAEDLAADFGRVLGAPARLEGSTNGPVIVRIDPALKTPESWRISVGPAEVVIAGADAMGAIYGIYRFSEAFLGVDPLWFWKGMEPAHREALRLPATVLASAPAAFRYRGWFVNDEDLLTEWKPGSGRRDLDYPFYQQVISLDVADRIFEALLRSGGNLVIPASFVDVMNPPEAALLRRAVARGLYVTQHHIEPLGVSHFGFETFWKRRGEKVAFSYSTDPDRVRQTWTEYAKAWREIAGDQVIWQLGLRGRGDKPVWASDPSVKAAEAGGFVSRALADQWAIVRSADPRPAPPATTTLWMEGSELMRKGELAFPPGVGIVFADEGRSQMLQDDFRRTPREAGRAYGVYYHLAFWIEGPHLVQGTRPEKLKRNFDALVARGDTNYAIVNVANVREHVLGIAASMEIMQQGAGWDAADFMARWAPPALQPLYRDFLASFVELPSDRLLQDGTCFALARKAVEALEKGQRPSGSDLTPALDAAIARLDRVARDYPAGQHAFYDVHLHTQAAMLRHFYACLRALLRAGDDRSQLAVATAELEQLLQVRRSAESGAWAGWYRGDKKENVTALLARMQALGGS